MQVSLQGSAQLQPCEMLVATENYGPSALTVSISVDSSDCGLPLGAIVGIALGYFAVAAALEVLMAVLARRRNQRVAEEHAKEMNMKQY